MLPWLSAPPQPRLRKQVAGFLLLLPCLVAPRVGLAQPPPADLVIQDARIFDSRNGRVSPGSVVIHAGRIVRVLPPGAPLPDAQRILRANGRLLTPGLVDVHHHVGMILADSVTAGGGDIAHLSMEPDSIRVYREAFAEAYLPYGVTTVREAGGDEAHLPLMQAWMERVPWAPDFHPCGGALITRDTTRVPYVGHIEVSGEAESRAKVRMYHDLGFRHVKLYWRLQQPEFAAALDEALYLDMHPFAHVDFGVFSLERALDLGCLDFEHAVTLVEEVLTPQEKGVIWNESTLPLLAGDMRGAYFVNTLEKLNAVPPDDPRLTALVTRLARHGGSVTPTLHVFAQPYGLTWFRSPSKGDFDDTSGFTHAMNARGRSGFDNLLALTLRLFEAGVRLNLGTDWSDPGRAALSEMLLLHRAGIPMKDVLIIATRHGALTLGIEGETGALLPGHRANAVLFAADPLVDAGNLLAPRIVIKDGVVYSSGSP